MKRQRGSSVLLLSVLLTSVILLAWSVLSTWHQSTGASSAEATTTAAASSDTLPPPLDSKGAKASLFYPVLKARGPQPGGSVVSKPLIVGNIETRAQ